MIVQKVLSFTQKDSDKQDNFLLLFSIDINALGPALHKHWNLITKEDGILVLQKHLNSTYDFVIVFRIVTSHVGC